MALIKGRLGSIWMAKYGAGATVMTDEAMTANGAKTVFTIDDATKRFIDPDTAVVVKYNGGAVTSYASIQRPGGVVAWTVSPGASAVTISGKYLAVAQVGECKSWALDLATESVEVTSFGDTFKRFTPMIVAGSVNIDGAYVDSTLFAEMVSTNARIGIDLFLDTTGGSEVRYTGYGTIDTSNITADIGGVVEQPFTIKFNDGPYYVAGLA